MVGTVPGSDKAGKYHDVQLWTSIRARPADLFSALPGFPTSKVLTRGSANMV